MYLKILQKYGIVLFIAILFLNMLPIDKLFSDGSYYRYSNNNGSVTFIEFKARDFEMMNRWFQSYRQVHPEADSIMYRLFKKNPLAFWRWRQYCWGKRYKLPYKSWSEIKFVRGKDPENKTGFQDF